MSSEYNLKQACIFILLCLNNWSFSKVDMTVTIIRGPLPPLPSPKCHLCNTLSILTSNAQICQSCHRIDSPETSSDELSLSPSISWCSLERKWEREKIGESEERVGDTSEIDGGERVGRRTKEDHFCVIFDSEDECASSDEYDIST